MPKKKTKLKRWHADLRSDVSSFSTKQDSASIHSIYPIHPSNPQLKYVDTKDERLSGLQDICKSLLWFLLGTT